MGDFGLTSRWKGWNEGKLQLGIFSAVTFAVSIFALVNGQKTQLDERIRTPAPAPGRWLRWALPDFVILAGLVSRREVIVYA
ncbi:hypothetical protein ACIQVO_16750 [Streptomyces sp. NPDC101062]|uniref:hypothetical protein n=1 Tax=unclassified Streptomyces TaxID=2593676 RepID=UPI00380C1A39